MQRHPRTGNIIKDDGSLFNEADWMSRINTSMTSFNELAVSVPTIQVELKSVYPLSKYRDRIIASNGGGVTQGDGLFTVATTDDPDSEVLFRSVERGRYVSGFDGFPGMGVALPMRPVGNQVIEWGYSDFNNGYVVGEDAQGLFTAIYVDGERTQVRRREDWINPMIGQFDPVALNVYRMPFRWYGSGPFKLQVTAVVNGVAQVINADTTSSPPGSDAITKDPNQPISIRIKNNGTAEPIHAFVAGRQFFVSGDYKPNRRVTSVNRLSQAVSDTFVPLIALRQKINFDGVYRSISTKLQGAVLLSNEDLLWQIRVFSTLTGGEWVNPPNTDDGVETAMESNISATAVSGGLVMYEDLMAGGPGQRAQARAVDLPQLDLPATDTEVVLCARRVTSGSATVSSVLRTREEW